MEEQAKEILKKYNQEHIIRWLDEQEDSIKQKIIKLEKKFKTEKNKILKLLKIKKNEPLGLASEKWVKAETSSKKDFFTIRNLLTINNQKYEFWITKDEQDTINSGHFDGKQNWTIINLKDSNFNKYSFSYLPEKISIPPKIIKNYYSQNPIKINNAIEVILSKTTLDDIKKQLEQTEKSEK